MTCRRHSDRELSSHKSHYATCYKLICPRHPSRLAWLAPLLCMQDARSKDRIVSSKVREAVGRLKKPAALSAVFADTLHTELTQGMSGNEKWHSWLRRTIVILGGMRRLAMTQIFLAWQMMRFSEAVGAARKKSAQKDAAFSGAVQMKARDKQLLACKQAFASALRGERSERRSRQAYHAWMHTSYDLAMMRAMGFSEAKASLQPRMVVRRGGSYAGMPEGPGQRRRGRSMLQNISTSSTITPCCGRRPQIRSKHCSAMWTSNTQPTEPFRQARCKPGACPTADQLRNSVMTSCESAAQYDGVSL